MPIPRLKLVRAVPTGVLAGIVSLFQVFACTSQPVHDGCSDVNPGDAGVDDCTCPFCPLPECGTPDSESPVDSTESPVIAILTLEDGSVIEGEWVTTYNHNYWWTEATAEFTYALFDAAQLNAYPNDRSFRFIPSDAVQSMQVQPWPFERESYRDVLRRIGMTLNTVCVPGLTHVVTAHDSYHLSEDGWGDHAIDLVLTDTSGRRFLGDGMENEDHLVWDGEVQSPITGLVVEVERGLEDRDPGEFELNAPANRVGISVEGSFYVYLYHFKKDTIPETIDVGSLVFEGTHLGRVGNSGMTVEPHLHVVLYWYDETGEEPRSWSVPVEFRDIEVASVPTGPYFPHEFIAPRARTWIRPGS